MNNISTESSKQAKLERLGVALFIIFIIGGLFGGYLLAKSTTLKIKNALQVQALTISSFINPEDLTFLKGDSSDLNNPKYQELKSRLIEAHSYNSGVQFIYILGKKSDGSLFYYIDSESLSSKNYAQPGQTYTNSDASEMVYFEKGVAYVKGPYDNLLGKWVTAYAPVYNNNGQPFAKIGIDISADEYKDTWFSVFFAAFAVGFLFALIILLFTIYLRSVVHLLRKGVSELVLVKNQKKALEESGAKIGLGHFKWNRTTGDLILSNFLADSFGMSINTNFEEFKKHLKEDEILGLEQGIIDACTNGDNTLVYELNFILADGSIKRIRMNCNFSQIYQNNPKVVEGTILHI